MSNVSGIEEKFTAFCSWVQAITGRPVIKARRRMNVQLKEPYCCVDLLSAPLITKDLKGYEDLYPQTSEHPLKEKIRGLVFATFQVTSLGGDDAMDCIHKLHASFRTDAWLVFARRNSFGTAGGDGMENLSAEFMAAAFENRAQLKVSFYIPVEVVFEECINDVNSFNVATSIDSVNNSFHLLICALRMVVRWIVDVLFSLLYMCCLAVFCFNILLLELRKLWHWTWTENCCNPRQTWCWTRWCNIVVIKYV